ncbi:hypothetical protein ACQP3F_31950, partial [Escherichia coli]
CLCNHLNLSSLCLEEEEAKIIQNFSTASQALGSCQGLFFGFEFCFYFVVVVFWKWIKQDFKGIQN